MSMDTEPKVYRAKLSDFRPDPNNANQHTQRGRGMVENSMSKRGYGRPAFAANDGTMLGGNLSTLEVAGAIDLGGGEVLVIETDGNIPIIHKRTDLDPQSEAARLLALEDNRTAEISLDWDPGMLQSELDAGLPLNELWFDFELQGMGITPNFENSFPDDSLDFDSSLPSGVPDTIWPSDNEWGIPLLDIGRQADAFDLPIEIWGAKGRANKSGTILFYTEDYRFNALWQEPDKLPLSGCVNAGEPNFSVYKDFPPAVALYRTYQKRWLARYWQSLGVRIFVDLNVNPAYSDINLMGIPAGWKAYATRGYSDRLAYTLQELERAEKHAAGPVLFLVYGGGKLVKDWCKEHAGRGVVWSDETMDRGVGSTKEGKDGRSKKRK